MPQLERPFLTARWSELLLLNFAVPTEAIAAIAPPGTEPDSFDGQTYISVVGFQFCDTRVRGWAVPGHTDFPEINLRYYVRRVVDGEIRRGVVFVQEIVPRRMIAIIANRVFHENYICRAMRSELRMSGSTLAAGDRVAYSWQSRGRAGRRWNTLAARIAGPLAYPSPGSFHEFIVEHYWGYARGRDGRTREYQVAHDMWRVADADEITWDCDAAASYNSPLARYLSTPPESALIADGATVEIYAGRTL